MASSGSGLNRQTTDHPPAPTECSGSSRYSGGGGRGGAGSPRRPTESSSRVSRMASKVVEHMHGESNIAGRGGLAGVQRGLTRAPTGKCKWGPHKGKKKAELSDKEYAEHQKWVKEQRKKVEKRWVLT